ncbi:hypothetical protein NQD34_011994 [Periophthalmus magnuspinnatus]|nr:hypothetical protein NQD34_011994 [Periophthalmus magnuspinnatus]
MEKASELFGRKSVIFVVVAILQITKHASAQNTTPPSSSTTVPLSTSLSASVPPSTSSPGPDPGPSQSYLTLPSNVRAGLGNLAQFSCGVPISSKGLTFTFYGSAHNYTISCPGGHIEDIPQALEGYCLVRSKELLAGWVLKGASLPDNGTRVVCQGRGYLATRSAYLYVYDNGSGKALLIGVAVGLFFGVLTVFGLLYLMLTRSERLQICFRAKSSRPEDLTEIMDNIEATATSPKPTLNEKMRDL